MDKKPSLVAIFGDVHGDSFKLRALITKIAMQYGGDYALDYYSLGDLLDRGPDSKGVLDTCLAFGVRPILGNHELWFHKYIATGEFGGEALHFMMGGKATIKSYSDGAQAGIDLNNPYVIQRDFSACIPDEHKAYILGMPLYRRIEVAGTTYWLIHGGLKAPLGDAFRAHAEESAGTEVSDHVLLEVIATVQPDSLLWDHWNPGDDMYRFQGGAVQVFGHAPQPEALDAGHFIALDTGCGRKRKPNALSAVLLFPDGGRELISTA